MYTIHKTRPSNGIYFALLPFAVLVATAVTWAAFGFRAAYTFVAIVFWVYAAYSLITVIRTQNLGFLTVTLFQFFAGVACYISAPILINTPDLKPVVIVLVACTYFFLVWALALNINKKIKWRGRELLELAAAPVEKIGNGYTPRPLPAGKTDYTRSQIEAFASFARRNLLAIPYVGKDKIVFVPVMDGKEFTFIVGLKGDYTDETWVAIDFAGNVSVNISHRDYMEYKDSLAFDQLCASLANLFVEFIAMHQRGEGVRIISRLDSVNIPWYA